MSATRVDQPSPDTVRFGRDEIEYHFTSGDPARIAAVLDHHLAGYDTALIIIDKNVSGHWRNLSELLPNQLRRRTMTIPVHESGKNLELVHRLLERAIDEQVGRRSVVVAMGGGVLGNIAGMVASLLYRGLPLIHLPTTPVAAFDSVLSTKQAVNLSLGKNLAGAYLTPRLIACDLDWLRTCPPDQLRVGLAEMAKNVLAVVPAGAADFVEAVAGYETDPGGSLRVLRDIGVNAKRRFLEIDRQEKGPALVFEYGHTFGHAIEFASGGRMSHGEAVAWGMLVAAEVSAARGHLPAEAYRRHHELVAQLDVSPARLRTVDLDAAKRLLLSDNKRGIVNAGPDDVAMVLLTDLGVPLVEDGLPVVAVPHTLVEACADRVLREYGVLG